MDDEAWSDNVGNQVEDCQSDSHVGSYMIDVVEDNNVDDEDDVNAFVELSATSLAQSCMEYVVWYRENVRSLSARSGSRMDGDNRSSRSSSSSRSYSSCSPISTSNPIGTSSNNCMDGRNSRSSSNGEYKDDRNENENERGLNEDVDRIFFLSYPNVRNKVICWLAGKNSQNSCSGRNERDNEKSIPESIIDNKNTCHQMATPVAKSGRKTDADVVVDRILALARIHVTRDQGFRKYQQKSCIFTTSSSNRTRKSDDKRAKILQAGGSHSLFSKSCSLLMTSPSSSFITWERIFEETTDSSSNGGNTGALVNAEDPVNVIQALHKVQFMDDLLPDWNEAVRPFVRTALLRQVELLQKSSANPTTNTAASAIPTTSTISPISTETNGEEMSNVEVHDSHTNMHTNNNNNNKYDENVRLIIALYRRMFHLTRAGDRGGASSTSSTSPEYQSIQIDIVEDLFEAYSMLGPYEYDHRSANRTSLVKCILDMFRDWTDDTHVNYSNKYKNNIGRKYQIGQRLLSPSSSPSSVPSPSYALSPSAQLVFDPIISSQHNALDPNAKWFHSWILLLSSEQTLSLLYDYMSDDDATNSQMTSVPNQLQNHSHPKIPVLTEFGEKLQMLYRKFHKQPQESIAANTVDRSDLKIENSDRLNDNTKSNEYVTSKTLSFSTEEVYILSILRSILVSVRASESFPWCILMLPDAENHPHSNATMRNNYHNYNSNSSSLWYPTVDTLSRNDFTSRRVAILCMYHLFLRYCCLLRAKLFDATSHTTSTIFASSTPVSTLSTSTPSILSDNSKNTNNDNVAVLPEFVADRAQGPPQLQAFPLSTSSQSLSCSDDDYVVSMCLEALETILSSPFLKSCDSENDANSKVDPSSSVLSSDHIRASFRSKMVTCIRDIYNQFRNTNKLKTTEESITKNAVTSFQKNGSMTNNTRLGNGSLSQQPSLFHKGSYCDRIRKQQIVILYLHRILQRYP